MHLTAIRIESGDQVPLSWGEPREAVRKTTVTIREAQGPETFVTSWGTLKARPGLDLVIIQDSGEEYPIKKEIFRATYKEIESGRFRRMARSRLVQVPEGVLAVLASKEGEIEVRHPDYVAIGPQNEVYANSVEWVAANLLLI